MSGLAHIFERAGIPTVVIALIPQHAERIAPPRSLMVPFMLGRPFGSPGDASFQHQVLDAALALLEQAGDPMIEWFEQDAPATQAEEDQWICPVSFDSTPSDEPALNQLLAEIALLTPWFDKGQAERNGRTTFGLSEMTIEDIAAFLVPFTTEDYPADSGELLKLVAEDLKAFYNEAATSQPGAATATAIEQWYWQDTQAGTLIKAIKDNCKSSDDKALKLTAKLLLVPESQH